MPMKPLNKNNTSARFWEGETSLKEDMQLYKSEEIGQAEKAYFDFINVEKQVPVFLEEEVWTSVVNGRHKKRKLMVRWVAAASVILAVGLGSVYGYQLRNDKLEMQFALIEQTLKHVSIEVNPATLDHVIYEDEFIVIVAEN